MRGVALRPPQAAPRSAARLARHRRHPALAAAPCVPLRTVPAGSASPGLRGCARSAPALSPPAPGAEPRAQVPAAAAPRGAWPAARARGPGEALPAGLLALELPRRCCPSRWCCSAALTEGAERQARASGVFLVNLFPGPLLPGARPALRAAAVGPGACQAVGFLNTSAASHSVGAGARTSGWRWVSRCAACCLGPAGVGRERLPAFTFEVLSSSQLSDSRAFGSCSLPRPPSPRAGALPPSPPCSSLRALRCLPGARPHLAQDAAGGGT